jgi:malate dehydrogenase (oxaloacetate-decarboxylating)
MGIPIGKTALYTGLGGIPGRETLPIMLDVGTDNAEILQDPGYVGWRHHRLKGTEYFEFVDMFVECVKKYFPHALLHWEDFNINTATPLLHKYRDQHVSLNDDISCTATVAVATLLAATHKNKQSISEQRVCVVGAGSAGCGIASMIRQAMIDDGLTEEDATARIYMVDRPGLMHDGISELRDFQRPLVQKQGALANWKGFDGVSYSLLDVMRNAKPTALIGVSGVAGLFTEAVIRAMTKGVSPQRPIIFPLVSRCALLSAPRPACPAPPCPAHHSRLEALASVDPSAAH